MSIQYYPGGIDGTLMLVVNGTTVDMKFFCWDVSFRYLTCDVEEKWMKSKSRVCDGDP